jgi:hypothetical protein
MGNTNTLLGLLTSNESTIILVLNQQRKASIYSQLKNNLVNEKEHSDLLSRVFTYEEWRVFRIMEHKNYCLPLDDVDEYLKNTLCTHSNSIIGFITMTEN